MGIFTGVKLHHRSAQPQGRIELPLISLDEQRNADAGLP
jgi:hypothetical protein